MEQPDLLCTALALNIELLSIISQRETHGTARFVVYCTCANYRVVEYYRVCRFRDVILEFRVNIVLFGYNKNIHKQNNKTSELSYLKQKLGASPGGK